MKSQIPPENKPTSYGKVEQKPPVFLYNKGGDKIASDNLSMHALTATTSTIDTLSPAVNHAWDNEIAFEFECIRADMLSEGWRETFMGLQPPNHKIGSQHGRAIRRTAWVMPRAFFHRGVR